MVEVSEAEIHIALQKTDDRNAFVDILRDFNERDLAKKFLERMDDFMDEISLENIKTIIEALLDVGDELSVGIQRPFDFDPQLQIFWIASNLLKKIDDHSRRGEIIKDAARTGEGLHSVVHLVSSLESNKKREEEPIILEKDLEELKTIALERIRQEAYEGKLLDGPRLIYTLFRWKLWSTVEEPRDYVSRVICSDEGVVKLLVGFLGEINVTKLGEYITSRKPVIQLEYLSEFVNLEVLLPKVESIKQKLWKSLSDREKTAVDAFLGSIQR